MLACSLPLCAQSWDVLRALKPGDRIKVLDTSGQESKGAFTSASVDAITVQSGGAQIAIERPRVRRIQVRSNARRARNILVGAGIGLAIGVTVDQTVGRYLRNESGDSYRALTYIAPIAVLAGIPAAIPAYRTIYRIPRK